MARSIHMNIAGVNLTISSPAPVIHREPGPSYRSFLDRTHKERGAVDVEIFLELGGIPSTEGLTTIFHSDQSWSMFQDDHFYYLESHPSGLQEPLWLARFDPGIRQVTVYCSQRLVTRRDDQTAVSNPVRYPLDQILLMYVLAHNEAALFHAAGADMNGKGFLFAGRSAAGKSTLSRLLAGRDAVQLLSDDRMAVRKIDGEFRAFGTPWPGDAGIALNEDVPLSAIFFIHHGADTWIKRIKTQQALEQLLPVVSIPWYDREIVPRLLAFFEDLISHIPTFELHFRPTAQAVNLLQEFSSTFPAY